MWNNHKKIILLAAKIVLYRSADVDGGFDEDKTYATTDIDTISYLEDALIEAFKLDGGSLKIGDIKIIKDAFEPVVQKVIDIDYSAALPDSPKKEDLKINGTLHTREDNSMSVSCQGRAVIKDGIITEISRKGIPRDRVDDWANFYDRKINGIVTNGSLNYILSFNGRNGIVSYFEAAQPDSTNKPHERT